MKFEERRKSLALFCRLPNGKFLNTASRACRTCHKCHQQEGVAQNCRCTNLIALSFVFFEEAELLFRSTDERKRSVNPFIAATVARALVDAAVRPSTRRRVLVRRRRSGRFTPPSLELVLRSKLLRSHVALFRACHRGNMRRRAEKQTDQMPMAATNTADNDSVANGDAA